jgi:hypothetical protein
MRSDVLHKAKCGKESAYYCRTYGRSSCHHIHSGCRYKLKILKTRKEKNELHPLAIKLTELYAQAAIEGKTATAWCIDLARTAFTYEQIAEMEGKPALFVQNKIKEKIERDKGVTIR